MPPRVGSRHTFTQVVEDEAGSEVTWLTEREPFGFRELDDTQTVQVLQGDTWYGLAARYYGRFTRASGFFWAVADYNNVVDPTVPPEPGTTVEIPSIETLTTRVLAERRRREH
jgi:nucleoid-associated protein YgaU